jgi:hypothetical protein
LGLSYIYLPAWVSGWSRLMRAGGEEVVSARVAQSVERSAVNRKVGGSNPPVSDIFYSLTAFEKKRSGIGDHYLLFADGLGFTVKCQSFH